MARLFGTQLELPRCPHCGVAAPMLMHVAQMTPVTLQGQTRFWRSYACRSCAGVVSATAPGWDQPVLATFPSAQTFSEDLPSRAREYLIQAFNSMSSPAGAVMLAASAVDSMLKAKALTAGSLYSRIDEAAAAHLITADMAHWAHDVRLDANDQRHADDAAPLPSLDQAKKCVEFAVAFGDFLFVLPARVQRGIADAGNA